MIPTTFPHGRTARRIQWEFLPPAARRAVEERLGSPVVEASSCDAGFTPGLASVLTCADGSRHFVKAASVPAQRWVADAYREEARKLGSLPVEAPAPRLLWTLEVEGWLVLGFEHVAGGVPPRPWRHADLVRAVSMLEEAAAVLTPAPEEMGLATFAEDLADFPAAWERVPASYPDLPADRVAEAAALARRLPEVTAGTTVVHTDVRDDNILLTDDGRTLLCDWNWPAVGAAWIDTVALMIGPRGDGLDVETVLTEAPLTRDVPRESVDVLLALLAGYFLTQAVLPAPGTSPHLRAVQAWQGEVCWQWLGERRGW